LGYDSSYGPIRVEWSCLNKVIRVEIEVPANTTAVVTLPEKEETLELGSGVYVYEYATETNLHLDRYSMEMPLRVLMEHPLGRSLLAQYAPEMESNKMLEYVIDQPITALLSYAPQIQPLFESIIAAMNSQEL
ncbi:MAG: alfa-L-rhamnosidase, partial [Lachnospiraceae bacterium]|nr:alfa-L-rhamnosidase [Lachnospiraceae bacterium]